MHGTPRLLAALAALAVVLTGTDRIAAEFIPPFNLVLRTEQADLVVHGRLDSIGKLTVDSALKGKPGAKSLLLANGREMYTALNRLEKQTGPLEVVVYLRHEAGRWMIDTGEHGVVGFLGNGVYLVHDKGRFTEGGAKLGRHPTLLRGPFLKNARDAVAAWESRTRLLASEPSAERLGKIASFYLMLKEDSRRHHLWALVRALEPLGAEEGRALVSLLKSSDPLARPRLLELAGATARGKDTFDAVASWLDARQPSIVRRASIEALVRIDAYRAQERLVPLLDIDEPE